MALWAPNLLFALLAGAIGWFRPGLAARRSPGTLVRSLLALGRRPPATARREPSPDPGMAAAAEDTGGLNFPLLIDRYVASSFVRVFVLVMASVYLVYLLVEFRSLIEDMVDHQTGVEPVLRYLVLLVPRMTSTILPIACLVATLVGLGVMARAGEDTALKAAGISAYRLLLTPFVLTIMISALGFGIQNEILPVSNRAAEALRDRIGGRTPRHNDPRQRWVIDDQHRIFHYESASGGGAVLQGLSILEVDPTTYALRSRTHAARAEFRSGTWILTDAWSRRFEGGESQMIVEPLKRVDLGITPEFFASERNLLPWGMKREQDQMSYQEQRDHIRELARQGYDTTTLRVGLAQKFSSCLIPVCMVLLGFPFAFMVGARGSLFGIGLAIGLSLIYWAALAVFNALGTAALLPPFLAAWVPNLLFGGMGVYLTLHVRT
jgi:lipopolysaccharide export system permease protein